jgi:hypothetical protein
MESPRKIWMPRLPYIEMKTRYEAIYNVSYLNGRIRLHKAYERVVRMKLEELHARALGAGIHHHRPCDYSFAEVSHYGGVLRCLEACRIRLIAVRQICIDECLVFTRRPLFP